eukprot:2756453-Alexandrium_andersonii.AAC.1
MALQHLVRDRLGQHICNHVDARKVPHHAATGLDQVLHEQPPSVHMAKVATDASSGGDAARCRGVGPQADAQQDAQAPEEVLDVNGLAGHRPHTIHLSLSGGQRDDVEGVGVGGQHGAVNHDGAASCGAVSYTHLTLPTICSV